MVQSLWILIALLLLPVPPPATPSQSPYAAEFEQARTETTNPTQLHILADNVITAGEYDQVIAGFVGCLSEGGYEIETPTDPFMPAIVEFVYTYPLATPGVDVPMTVWQAYDKAFEMCSRAWLNPVAGLYSATVYFPDNDDVFEANLACLHADGLVPEAFDRDDLDRAATTGEWGDGIEPWTDAFTICLVNPHKIGLNPIATPQATPPD